MSQIAPDIPELCAIPKSARAIVYMSAMSAAIRSPATLIPGALLLLLATTIGGTQGYQLFGIVGALAGAPLGAGAGAAFFFKILLPWRARQLIPELLRQADPPIFDQIARADDALGRMIGEYKQREMPQGDRFSDRNS
jgi:hypothetical protein